MKKFIVITIFFITVTVMSAGYGIAKVPTEVVYENDVVEHGGGCRKSSPPGMCCHMDSYG